MSEQKLSSSTDTEQLSTRLIVGGCILLVLPCGFLMFTLMFYLLPVFAYAITGG